MASEIFDSVSSAFSEALQAIDPGSLVQLTAPNGQSAQVIATAFVQSETLKPAMLENKLPAAVQMLRADFIRLAIVDRSQVTVAGHVLTVVSIGDDPVDPTVQLTLTEWS